MKIRNKNMLFYGSVGLIILAIALVGILNRTRSSQDPDTDVRARASATTALKLNGVIIMIDPEQGTITVDNIYFADTSRSGDAKNLGRWTVTPPANIALSEFSPGMNIAIGVDPKTFLATAHTLTALSVVRTDK
jgi:hypothetical protein